MDYKEYDQETLNKLHQVHMEILDEFVRICMKHQLTYFLVGGTLLGAVRHKGFIPWDDDVDVGMPRCDYEKFLKIAQKELKDMYYLDYFPNNEEYYLQFAKIKKNNTIFDEKSSHHINNHKGIFIDVFPIDNVSPNLRKAHIDAVFIKMMSQTINVKKKIIKLGNTNHPFFSFFLLLLPCKSLMKIGKWLCTKNKDNNSKYLACLVGSYPFRSELLERVDVFPTISATFEKHQYQIMNNYDKYLKNIYGDYLKLPPEEKRINHKPLDISFGEGDEK